MVERKLLGALLQLANDDGIVEVPNMQTLADQMHYKKHGGTVTYALKMLEIMNKIAVMSKPKRGNKVYVIRVLV